VRLQLIVALVVVPRLVAADPRAEAALRVYTDDDDITVVSPSARAETTAGVIAVEVDASADVVTGASIDVVTAASPRSISERRLELGLAAARPVARAGTIALSSSVRGSVENDHSAARAGAGARVELLDRQLTLETRYLGGRDAIGSASDPDFHEARTLHQLSATASLVLDPRTIADVVLEGTRSSGYHASPYRRVPLVASGWPTPTWLAEEVPGLRRSIAAAARLRHALGTRWFTTLGYRAYRDDWSIASHTASVDLRWQLGGRALVGLDARAYLQDGAGFYRSTYVIADGGEMPPWRTRDRTLGPMRTAFASVTADVAVSRDQTWHAIVAGGVLVSWFLDFPLQSDRHALIVTLALSRSLGGEP
jgi:hypothetical protein